MGLGKVQLPEKRIPHFWQKISAVITTRTGRAPW